MPVTLNDLYIRTKTKQVVRFEPNVIQSAYFDLIIPGWRDGPIALQRKREIILKARQFGFSTAILALLFMDTVNNPHTSTVVIAHDAESTERLFQIVQRFYTRLPPEKQPRTRYANRREYLWPDIDSTFFVGQAGSKDFGRGSTVNNVLASEVGAWAHGEEIVSGLLQAVPADGNVFIESTAQGIGNYYHSEYTAAQKGDSTFQPRFYAWFQHPEYRTPLTEPLPAAPDEKSARAEASLRENFDVSDEQLLWRRDKLKELRDNFPQEYPATPAEAFLTSGHGYFDRLYLQEVSQALGRPEFAPLAGVEIPAEYARLARAYREGELEIWELPQPGAAYAIGADTAEGLTASNEADFDAADVGNCASWLQAAHLHGKWDTHEYGQILNELGRWYNTALLAVERNNHGHAVLNALIHTCHYPECYTREQGGLYYHEEYDEFKAVHTQRPGWPTTAQSKAFCLDALRTSTTPTDDHGATFHLRSQRTVSEMLTYVNLPGGKSGGEGKSHDDAVISAALLVAMFTLKPARASTVVPVMLAPVTEQEKEKEALQAAERDRLAKLPDELVTRAMSLLASRKRFG